MIKYSIFYMNRITYSLLSVLQTYMLYGTVETDGVRTLCLMAQILRSYIFPSIIPYISIYYSVCNIFVYTVSCYYCEVDLFHFLWLWNFVIACLNVFTWYYVSSVMVFHKQILPFCMSRTISKPHALSKPEIENREKHGLVC